MDLGRMLDGSQRVIRNENEDGSAAVVLTAAGLIGLCGMSNRGFGVCVNALVTLNHNAAGLPVAFVLRGALAQPDAEAALQFLRRVPHASGQHYAVVGRGAQGQPVACGMECSAGGVAEVAVGKGFGHANHPLASKDVDSNMKPYESRSSDRQAALDAALPGVNHLEDLVKLLADPPVCVSRRDSSDWFTFGAVAMEFGPIPRLLYTLGPPSQEEWHGATVEPM
eukprot:EG_transcript_16735